MSKTIEEVILRLSALVDESIQTDARIGYFAALYLRVTHAVRRSILAGNVFQNNERMAQLDIIFADRFLQAWDTHLAGKTPTAPWALAFDQLKRDDITVVQHLALGMNAHIDLDLGIAAEQTCRLRKEEIASLRDDFLTINKVLGRLTPMVQLQLTQLSTTFSRLEILAPKLQARLFGVALGGVREGAWLFTDRLARQKGPKLRAAVSEERIALTVLAGKELIDPLLGESILLRIAQEEAERPVRDNIQVIAG